ncbi:hypothetical protein EVAR_67124_1 [Eumeta japonica]|uniref:Uncharacterized protein n=1 Tax=Eumeta variegata TaxID=151549 RepID=A0A4C1ZXL1_EUMVA|nr:hypothetical protein EVAR_67124_1 [Eumeta japonica]
MGRPSKPAANRSHPYPTADEQLAKTAGAPARRAVPAPANVVAHVRAAAARKHFKTPATRPPPPARVGGRTLMYVRRERHVYKTIRTLRYILKPSVSRTLQRRRAVLVGISHTAGRSVGDDRRCFVTWSPGGAWAAEQMTVAAALEGFSPFVGGPGAATSARVRQRVRKLALPHDVDALAQWIDESESVFVSIASRARIAGGK